MKFAVKRCGFNSADVEKLAKQSDYAIWAVVCLSNEGCAIGNEHPNTLRNHLAHCFGKYARTYGVFIDLKTGEIKPRCVVNRKYKNRLSHEILDLEIKQLVLKQLQQRFWHYSFETGVELWMGVGG
ncbi:MAG: hypothetical protein LBM12_01945 [Candidatus Nomurabacteria bacterium]|jgi:hypothetical protein|nr:hypothetical protein [Candidatus Nomurabacteria bacterium]